MSKRIYFSWFKQKEIKDTYEEIKIIRAGIKAIINNNPTDDKAGNLILKQIRDGLLDTVKIIDKANRLEGAPNVIGDKITVIYHE